MRPRLSRYAGLAAVATLWLTLAAAARRAGFPLLGASPLSGLVGDPRAAWLYRAGLSGGAVLLVVFHRYVRTRYRVSRTFSVALLVGLAGQVVAAAVPIDGGPTAHAVHTVAALTLGASLPVLMWRFAAAQEPGRWRRLTYGLCWAEVAACGAGLVLSRHAVAPLAEIVPAACFHLWIAALTVADGPVAARSPRGMGALAGP
jgi:hypothetical protein